MADKRKAPVKSRAAKSSKAAGTKTPTKAKTVAKRAATTAAASRKASTRKTVAKSAAKATSAKSLAKRAVKKATPAKKAASAKKPVAAKKTVKKVVAKNAASKKTVTAKSAAKTTKRAAATKVAAKAAPKKAAAKGSRKASAKQTAASRKALLSAAARKFLANGVSKKAPNVSGSTRAAALKAAGTKPKHSAVRALAAASSTVGGKKVANPASGGVDTPKSIAQKAAASRVSAAANKKAVHQRHGFKTNEQVVYPAHGVGKIVGIEEQEIAGMALELFVIHFEKEKLTLRVPTGKLESVGMRKLSDEDLVTRSMGVLKGRARVKRTMWSRRAQEYVAKINSGDLILIAEVVRDLYRSESQPEQSYSERQLYEDALDRMAREVAAVEKLDERGAVQSIVEVLSKSARSRRVLEEAKDAESGASKAA